MVLPLYETTGYRDKPSSFPQWSTYGGSVESMKRNAGKVGVRVGAAGVGAYLTATLGPEGGAAAAETLAQAGEAVVGWLAERSQGRVARTLLAVSEEAAGRRSRGESLREDLANPQSGDAAALFEAVVEAAAQSAEDRKCEVIANAYASIAFDPLMSIDDALLYVRRIQDSSWRQLVALQYLLADDRHLMRSSWESKRPRRLNPSMGNRGLRMARL
jgi:hypothetical protein